MESIIASMAIALTLNFSADGEVGRTNLMVMPMIIAALGIVASILGFFWIRMIAKKDPAKAIMNGTYVAAGLTIAGTAGVVAWLGTPFIGGMDGATE